MSVKAGSSVHQLVHTLSYGDAISGEVLALQRCLRAVGYSSEIYAINVHPELKGTALPYADLDASNVELVILHYSIGSPLNRFYSNLVGVRRVMVYHNLTPSRWFWGVNPRIVRDLEHGRTELPQLCGQSDLLIADSRFNARELEELGYAAEVLELPLDPHKWDVPTNLGIAQLLAQEGGLHLLHVGRLAPNKCVEDIVKVFYFLYHKINQASRLWLVGIDIDTELYSFQLKRLVDELGLTDAVQFTGCLADSELKALYEGASVYLCMSEHEGFCVPVLEAMHFGCPVVAYASSALPDTVGAGGILLHEKRLAETAELVQKVYTDRELAEKIRAAGHKRAAELSYENFCQRVQAIFSMLG